MKRPSIISIVAYVLLLQVLSMLLMVYRAKIGGYYGTVAIYPGSRLPIGVQWSSLGAFSLVDLLIAVGLLRGDRWARPALALISIVGVLVIVLPGDTTSMKTSVLSNVLTLALLLALYTGPGARYFDTTGPKRPCFERKDSLAIVLHALAAFGTYVILTALFARRLPAHPADGQGNGPALFLAFFGVLVLVAYGIQTDRARMFRQTALLLITLSGFVTYLCVISELSSRILYPTMNFHFNWNDTIPWLIALAAVGVGLLMTNSGPKIINRL